MVNARDSRELDRIESELQQMWSSEKQRWQHTATLLMRVEAGDLWREHSASFTQWVKSLAIKIGAQESTLWRALKGGRIYQAIRSERLERRGAGVELRSNDDSNESLPELEQAEVSPESLELLDKIRTVAAPAVVERLTDRLLRNDVQRRELRETWQNLRPAAGGKTRRGRGSTEITGADKLTADGIVAALRQVSQSTTQAFRECLFPATNKHPFCSAGDGQYELFGEFAVETGTTKHMRRIDAFLVLETNEYVGIEIKISEHDLLNDHKYTEYMPYCHRFFLAVPPFLADVALNNAPEQIGVLTIDESLAITVNRFSKLAAVDPSLELFNLRQITNKKLFSGAKRLKIWQQLLQPQPQPHAVDSDFELYPDRFVWCCEKCGFVAEAESEIRLQSIKSKHRNFDCK